MRHIVYAQTYEILSWKYSREYNIRKSIRYHNISMSMWEYQQFGEICSLQKVVDVYYELGYLVVLSHGGAVNPIQDSDISP